MKTEQAKGETSDQELFVEAQRLYESGQYGESFSRYAELARKGYSSAQIFLGWMCNEGIGRPKNEEQALKWFKEAADGGSPEGMYYCGRLLEEEGHYGAAFEYVRLSAGKSYPPALCRLGLMYLVGRGVAQNEPYALQYLRRAADGGNVFARRELAVWRLRHGTHLLDRVQGAFGFVQAVAQAFLIGWRDPHSERIRC